MGCDIHLFVEKRDKGIWQRVDAPNYHRRNYSVFSILANVRNGSDTFRAGGAFNPISKPRGLPSDLSNELQRLSEGDELLLEKIGWLGDHSFSWLLADELLRFDWDQTTEMRGVIELKDFKVREKLDDPKHTRPNGYAGGVFGEGIATLSEDDARAVLAGEKKLSWDLCLDTQRDRSNSVFGPSSIVLGRLDGTAPPPDLDKLHVEVRWIVTYKDDCGAFYSKFLPALAAVGDPKDVRIVFGFDS